MTLEDARGIAARCWCDPATSNRVMDPELAEVMGRQLLAAYNLGRAWAKQPA